jgi:hypothetical protein
MIDKKYELIFKEIDKDGNTIRIVDKKIFELYGNIDQLAIGYLNENAGSVTIRRDNHTNINLHN